MGGERGCVRGPGSNRNDDLLDPTPLSWEIIDKIRQLELEKETTPPAPLFTMSCGY